MGSGLVGRLWLDPKDKPGLLLAFMREFSGIDSWVSFEGYLTETPLVGLPGASSQETETLQRQGVSKPATDFIVAPLTADAISIIRPEIYRAGGLTDPARIIHVQIAKNGRLLFGGYDNFHRECIIAYDCVPRAFLDELVRLSLIRGYG